MCGRSGKKMTLSTSSSNFCFLLLTPRKSWSSNLQLDDESHRRLHARQTKLVVTRSWRGNCDTIEHKMSSGRSLILVPRCPESSEQLILLLQDNAHHVTSSMHLMASYTQNSNVNPSSWRSISVNAATLGEARLSSCFTTDFTCHWKKDIMTWVFYFN